MTPIIVTILPVFCCVVTGQYAEDTEIIRVPLERMETGLEKLLRRGADFQLIENLYNMHLRAEKDAKLLVNGKPIPTNGTVPLFKYFDTQYYGLINIGKPGQTFKMIMDTAWSFTWVPSADCSKLKMPCAFHQKYDHHRSSTYKPDNGPFNISNKFLGYKSVDVFLAGQMNVTAQTFAELTDIPWIFALYEADGTIGLGLKGLSPGVVPFFYNLYTQNNLKPIFSFFINRDPTTTRGGSLFLGGIDTKHNKTEFLTVDVTSNTYWQFRMDKVKVVLSKKSHQELCVSGCTALADTSAIAIVGPREEIKKINTLIGAQEIFFMNRYMIPCINEFKGPKVNFTINNRDFQITARDYIQKISYSGFTLCLSAFQPAQPDYPNNTWVLGGAFLYQFYTAYDVVNKKIMIAEVA